MSSAPKVPAAPDPAATGAAQTKSNQETALYQAQLNNVNQYTPYGSQTYTENPGVNGAAPTFTSNISLSPAEQAILTNQEGLQTQQQGIAGQALNQAAVNQATPYSLGGLPGLASASNISDAENAGYQDSLKLLQPEINQQDELLQSKLANQGVTQNSQAWNAAEQNQNIQDQQAYSSAALTGVSAGQALQQEALSNNQQAVADYTQQYNAPVNEYQALQNGVQVQNPTFSGPQGNAVAPTNTAQITQNAYQSALNANSAANASNNSLMGSLFGLGGSFLGSGALGGGIGGAVAGAGLTSLTSAAGVGALGSLPGDAAFLAALA